MGVEESTLHPAEQQSPNEDFQIRLGNAAFHRDAEYMHRQCLSMQIYWISA